MLDAVKGICDVDYAKGYDAGTDEVNEQLINEAVECAKRNDVAVIFAGLTDLYESEGFDRKHMKMPQNQLSLIESICEVCKNVVVVLHNGSPVELPFLVGLGRFIGYLQERQDYIATISTNYIPYGAPVNLKDAIYDELNPDLRYLRHRAESSSDTKNRPSNILLNYIAKSEGLSRENMDEDFLSKKDIRLGFVDYSSGAKQFFGLDSEETTDRNMCFASANAALSQMRKINFSLPGGLVGRQAVFSILENLIRNAAKHGNTTSVDNLDFTLDVIDGAEVLKGICPECSGASDLHL